MTEGGQPERTHRPECFSKQDPLSFNRKTTNVFLAPPDSLSILMETFVESRQKSFHRSRAGDTK